MALVVMGRSQRGGLDLPVSLFIVLHALRLECVKSMFWTVSFHCVRLLLSSLVMRELAARSGSLPVEAWVIWKRASHSLSQHSIYSFLLPRGTHCFAALMVMLHRAWYAVFPLRASGSGSLLPRLLVIVP